MRYIFEDCQDDTELELSTKEGRIHAEISGSSNPDTIYFNLEEADKFSEALDKVIKEAKKYREENPEE